jgi:lipoprotein-anchoring transpeptidase ErfK/SrfK
MSAARAALLLAVLLLAGCGGAEPPAAAQPEPPAFTPAPARDAAEAEERPRGRYVTARVLAPVRLRAAPGGRRLERLHRRTEFGSPKVLAVVGRRGGWLKVLAPERPNHRPGWIPASSARLGAVGVSIHVDRSARRLTVRRDGRLVRRMAVAVGRPGTPTPLGRFAVTDRLRTGRPDSPYGCCALALSGHQTKLLPGWPGGDRLAIHATPQPETIGTAASLGCLRAATRHLKWLMRSVPLGAPVLISA